MRLSSSSWVIAQRVTTARDFLIRLASLREAVPTRCADGRGDAEFFNTLPAMSYWIQALSFRQSVSCTCEIYRTKLCWRRLWAVTPLPKKS